MYVYAGDKYYVRTYSMNGSVAMAAWHAMWHDWQHSCGKTSICTGGMQICTIAMVNSISLDFLCRSLTFLLPFYYLLSLEIILPGYQCFNPGNEAKS